MHLAIAGIVHNLHKRLGFPVMMRLSGLLRPTFTEDLATRLQHGAGIQLVSPHGQGRRRTLADLRRCLPDSMTMLQANLREYPQDLTAMLADLGTQAGTTGTGSFGAWLDVREQGPERTLIVLHNLDELQEGTDSGYDDGFFAALNGVKERPGLSLLCVSERLREAWPLHLEVLMLPPLTADEILTELQRRNPAVASTAWPGLARWMAAQPAPYSLLERPEEAWPPT